jgi:flagellar basal-body rod protein FlgC
MIAGALPVTDGTVPSGAQQAYAPLQVVQTANGDGDTQTTVTTVNPSYVATSDPQAPFANQDGLVAAPNVDISREMVDQMIASYTFAANARVLKADDRMTKTLIDTLA